MNNVLAYSTITVPFTHTGDILETVAMTHTVTGGDFPANGFLDLDGMITRTGSASPIIVRARLGGLTGQVISEFSLNANGTSARFGTTTAADNATNSQNTWNSNTPATAAFIALTGQGTTPLVNTTVDFTSNVDVVVTVQLGNASDSAVVHNSRLLLSAS